MPGKHLVRVFDSTEELEQDLSRYRCLPLPSLSEGYKERILQEQLALFDQADLNLKVMHSRHSTLSVSSKYLRIHL